VMAPVGVIFCKGVVFMSTRVTLSWLKTSQ
jgi:hypothetical protein